MELLFLAACGVYKIDSKALPTLPPIPPVVNEQGCSATAPSKPVSLTGAGDALLLSLAADGVQVTMTSSGTANASKSEAGMAST